MNKNLLLVMSPFQWDSFVEYLDEMDLDLHFAPSAAEAARILHEQPEVEVVVVDQELNDGSWKDVVEAIADRDKPASLLICTKAVGDKEILTQSRRIHIPDMLIKPYEKKVVQERILNALQSERREPLEGSAIPSHPATAE